MDHPYNDFYFTTVLAFRERYGPFPPWNWDALVNAYKDGTLQPDAEQTISSIELLCVEYFDDAFLNKYATHREAYVKGWVQFDQLIYRSINAPLDASNKINADMIALDAWWEETHTVDLYDSFEKLTAFWLELEARTKAIADKIVEDNTPPEPKPDPIFDFFASFLPEGIAIVLTWIVKIVFFGWLWGRWL